MPPMAAEQIGSAALNHCRTKFPVWVSTQTKRLCPICFANVSCFFTKVL